MPRFCLGGLLAMFLGTGVSTADIINVPDDHPTIQQAIDAASDGDEVVVHPGTYYEHLEFNGRQIVLRSVDPSDRAVVEATRLDGSKSAGPIISLISGQTQSTQILGLTITNGYAARGAGIYLVTSSPLIRNCIFLQNDCTVAGAGIDGLFCTMHVDSCRFLGNGGQPSRQVISGDLCDIRVTNSVFSGNNLHCVWAINSTIEVINCSFNANMGSAVRSVNGVATAVNCVRDLGNDLVTASQGDVTYSHCGNLGPSQDQSNFYGVVYYMNPMGPDGITGTLDDDLRLNRFSPCIDRGDNVAAHAAGLLVDIDGLDRFVDDAGVDDLGEGIAMVDIGAFERQSDSFQMTFPVTPSDSIADTLPLTTAGDIIELQPGFYTEQIRPMGRPVSFRSVDPLDAEVVASTVLIEHPDGGPQILCDGMEDNDTIFEGLTVAGNFSGSSIYTWESSPQFRNCVIRDNQSAESAVYCDCECYSCFPMFVNCLFFNNFTAFRGGAVNTTDAGVTFVGCEFIGNSAYIEGGAVSTVDGEILTRIINCTFAGNQTVFGTGGALHGYPWSNPQIHNCIFHGNFPQSISDDAQNLVVEFSLIEEGYPGLGNIDADPLFIDVDGPDDILGTLDDDTRLSPHSPAIDAGSNAAFISFEFNDLAEQPRFTNDPCTIDTGEGQRPIIDMGAYEFQPCIADINCDDTVTVDDLLMLLGSWGECLDDCPADLNNDFIVGTDDLLLMLAHWNDC